MATFISPDQKVFTPSPADYKEVARYLGYKKSITLDSATLALITRACEEMLSVLKPQAVYEKFDLTLENIGLMKGNRPVTKISFADVCFDSVDLGQNLKNCTQVYLLAATIGPQVDAMIRKASMLDPVYGAVLQATGPMYVEKLVDLVNEEIKKDGQKSGKTCHPRYSPGYGDVSLELQKDFFRLLPCTRIGLTLMSTLIMAPEKSVTAFIGC